MSRHDGVSAFLSLVLFLPQVISLSDVATDRVSDFGDVTVQATPHVVYDGQTGQMSVNCSYLKTPGSNINLLMSLILSKTNSSGNSAYHEIASVTTSSPDSVLVKDAMGATVTGHMADNSSYITFQWSTGVSHLQGTYRCQAYGMDKAGHPRSDYDTTTVTHGSVNMNVLAEKILMLEQSHKDLQTRLDNTLTELHTQKSCVATTLASRLNASLEYLKEAAMTYNGHHYVLSRIMFMNHPDAASRCHLYGGYLAEIDDSNEYEVVRNFTKANDKERLFIALGGTDYHHEGNWTLEESGKLMNYTNFYPGEPNAGNQDCLYLSEAYLGKMVNWVCYGSQWIRFLCEIPYQTAC